jgi:hypothetical protein
MPLAVVAGNNEYRLVKLVATSPLGSVYHARHATSERVVAVRLLRGIGADRAAMATFREQMPAIAVMRHRAILPVEGWGDADGIPYVVTPLPDAGLLADLLAGGWRPDHGAAVRFLRGIADALDYAHGLGVVHGGLEPASVLVAADGSALVAHFGLTHLAGAAPAPVGAVGPAADVRAFAAIAWDLLAGGAVPDGGAAAPEAPELPAAAGDVLRRTLDGDPAARWAGCGALLDALEAALSAPPAAAPRVGGRGRSAMARARVAAAAGLVLVAGVGTVLLVAGRVGPTAPAPGPAAALSGAGNGAVSSTPVGVEPSAGAASPVPSIVPVAAPSAVPSPTAPPPAAPARPAPAPARSAPAPPPAPPPPAGLSIAVSDPTPRAGQSNVMVTGHGFDPNQQYVVVFTQGRGWRLLFGPASPRANGDFVSPVQIPTTAQPGGAQLVACVYRVNQGPTPRCAATPLTVRP